MEAETFGEGLDDQIVGRPLSLARAAREARAADIAARVSEREADIEQLLQVPEESDVEILPVTESDLDAEGAQRLDEIRQSVTDESVTEAIGAVQEEATPPPSLPEDTNPRSDLQDEGEDPPPPPPGLAPPAPGAPPVPPAPRVAPAPHVQVTDMSTEGERSE